MVRRARTFWRILVPPRCGLCAARAWHCGWLLDQGDPAAVLLGNSKTYVYWRSADLGGGPAPRFTDYPTRLGACAYFFWRAGLFNLCLYQCVEIVL